MSTTIVCITPDVVKAHEENGYHPNVLYTSSTENIGKWNVTDKNKVLLHIPRNASPDYLRDAMDLREMLKGERNFHIVADQPQFFQPALRKCPVTPLGAYFNMLR